MFTSVNLHRTTRSTLLLLALFALFSCSKNEDDNPGPSTGGSGAVTGTPTVGYSYIFLDIQGPALSINDTISLNAVGDPNDVLMAGAVLEVNTSEGVNEVVSLNYYTATSQDSKDVRMTIPAEVGSNALGSFVLTSTGVIIDAPTFNVKVNYSSAFYDNDGDGDNDVLTSLLSTSATAVTVTAFERYTGGSGVDNLDFIKGRIIGTMEIKAYVDPFTLPITLIHTITGTFEYHRD